MGRVPTDLVRVSEAASLLGVTKSTVARWHDMGKLLADVVTPGGERRWSRARLLAFRSDATRGTTPRADRRTIAYARVSTSDQKDDLARQEHKLSNFCAARGWEHSIVRDIGSGLNYKKKGLKALIDAILGDGVERLVLADKDRLLRFGAELVFMLCEARDVEVIVINDGSLREASFEDELARDVLEIVTVFSARLYGARSQRNRKMLADIAAAAHTAAAQPHAAPEQLCNVPTGNQVGQGVVPLVCDSV